MAPNIWYEMNQSLEKHLEGKTLLQLMQEPVRPRTKTWPDVAGQR
jgi:hypothetical protein